MNVEDLRLTKYRVKDGSKVVELDLDSTLIGETRDAAIVLNRHSRAIDPRDRVDEVIAYSLDSQTELWRTSIPKPHVTSITCRMNSEIVLCNTNDGYAVVNTRDGSVVTTAEGGYGTVLGDGFASSTESAITVHDNTGAEISDSGGSKSMSYSDIFSWAPNSTVHVPIASALIDQATVKKFVGGLPIRPDGTLVSDLEIDNRGDTWPRWHNTGMISTDGSLTLFSRREIGHFDLVRADGFDVVADNLQDVWVTGGYIVNKDTVYLPKR